MQPGSTSLETIPTLIHRPPSYVEPIDLQSLFPRPLPLEVELGSGDGGFLVQWAASHPERNFLGVERLLGRLRKLDRKGRRAGLQNLRLIRIEASYFLKYLLPAGSVDAIHVYFPDPWPKRKHRKHRLINSDFAEAATRATKPGGYLYLRTDDADYFAQMRTVFDGHDPFPAVEAPRDLEMIQTDFEKDFNARGVATLRAAYQRK